MFNRWGSSDEWDTPAYAVDILAPYLPKDKVIWEGCWGRGVLAGHLRKAGYPVVGGPKIKFYQRLPFAFDILVTNPPHSSTGDMDSFIDHAYWFGKPFALLLPLDALGGIARHRLYRRYGVELILPDRRMDFVGGQGHCCFHAAWFCWGLSLPSPLTFVKATWR